MLPFFRGYTANMSAIVSIHELGLPMKTNLGSVARHIHRVLAIDFLHCICRKK